MLRTFVCRNGTRVTQAAEGSIIQLPNGKTVEGYPQHSAEQARTARDLGYGPDVFAMCRDHDPLHAAMTDWLGLPHSFALMDAAGLLNESDRELASLEEAAVIAVQAFMRKAGRPVPAGATGI